MKKEQTRDGADARRKRKREMSLTSQTKNARCCQREQMRDAADPTKNKKKKLPTPSEEQKFDPRKHVNFGVLAEKKN